MFTRFSLIFIGLFILTVPFEQPLLPDWHKGLAPFLESFLRGVGSGLLGLSPKADYRLASDSTGLYLYSGLLILLAASIAFVWEILDKKGSKKEQLQYFLQAMSSGYLSMQLLAYGFSKVFKVQFFQAEPNTLFTPLGQLSPDILFWTSMGSSYSYTVFAGIIELIPAFLLLFRRTRLLGALIATAVLINVLMLNLGFDISVKVYSTFLVFLCIAIIAPKFRQLYQFFILQEALQMPESRQPKLKASVYWTLKSGLIIFLIVNALYPYIQNNNFNDDKAERPYLHGAYQVENFVFDGDTLPSLSDEPLRWKRVFVHRRGYFIVQNMQDKMMDFVLEIHKEKELLRLIDYNKNRFLFQFNFTESNGILRLNGNWRGHKISLNAKKIDLQQLPLLKHHFHWTVD